MSKLINVYHHLDTNKKIEGFYNIEINSINDELVNYSNNIVHCGSLEYLDYQYIEQAISIMFTKVRLGGSLLITFTNYKNICSSYLNSSLKDTDFISLLKNKQSVLSINYIKNIIQNTPGSVLYKIENIPNEYKTSITINRTSL